MRRDGSDCSSKARGFARRCAIVSSSPSEENGRREESLPCQVCGLKKLGGKPSCDCELGDELREGEKWRTRRCAK